MIVAWVFAAALVIGISVRERNETTRSVMWALRITFVICLMAEIVR